MASLEELSERIRSHSLAKPGAFEDHPWGDTVWKVAPKGKIFCFGGGTRVTVRATLDEQSALIQLPGIVPAPYLARHGWVSVDLEEPQNHELVFDLIDRSYELVTAKKARAK
jgi:predicted DNA-binding protein (MmcQ/YjbR family)